MVTTKPEEELDLDLRPCQRAKVENEIACFICSIQNVRFFKCGGGIEQHFRTAHKGKWTDEVQKKCERVTKRMHGDEMINFLQQLMLSKAKKVGLLDLLSILCRKH